MILGEADALEKATNFLARILDAQMFESEFHGSSLVVSIKNLEIARQPKAFCFTAQEPCGERVECSDPGVVVRLSLADQQIADALLPLPAPARINTGPSVVVAASCWPEFNSSRSVILAGGSFWNSHSIRPCRV